ncbi:MAG: hypothetical protein HUU55_04570 [Myxococcales bacterium]|nr:hypothetical protein [Myxococcales bacterium]
MNIVEQNKWYAAALNWKPSDWGVEAFDEQLVAVIKQWQAGHPPLTVDGICGPATLETLFAAKNKRRLILEGEGTSTQDVNTMMAVIGEQVRDIAKQAWLMDILDPPTSSTKYKKSREFIDDIIRTPSGLNWTWEDPYVQDGDYAWCGAFAAYAWGGAGLRLDLRKLYGSSCYRLNRAAQHKSAFGEDVPPKPADPDKQRKYVNLITNPKGLVQFGPRAGDILLVGAKNYGSHIAIVDSFDPASGLFHTYEGNATGTGPYSNKIVHGVIKTTQPLKKVRRILRWSIDDLA